MSDVQQGWFILELMGHRRLAGYLTEQTIAGAGFLRIDVPGEHEGDPVATQFYPPSSVYCMTPTTEAMARQVARSCRVRPVQQWELLTAPPQEAAIDDGRCALCADPDCQGC